MRTLLLALVGLVGCYSPKSESPVPSNALPGTTADREFAKRIELDYRSPMRKRWLDGREPRDVELWTDMCSTGDSAACLRVSKQETGVVLYIGPYCRAGDDLSCRYITWFEGKQYPTLSIPALRRGCAAGLRVDCDLLLASASISDVRFGAETRCRYDLEHCDYVARSFLEEEPRDLMRARFLFELDCQAGSGSACLWLVNAYRTRQLAEPVPRRGDDLHRYLCGRRYESMCPRVDTKCVEWLEALRTSGECHATTPTHGGLPSTN